jgi:REP element-mobilizing transposase RayT
VPHRQRAVVSPRHPVLVTLKALAHVWNLRGRRVARDVLRALFEGRLRRIRIVHFSIQHDHVHLIVEAATNEDLSRGMQGLAVRLARAINRVMRRTGKVWKERFHSRTLETPREVRNALAYVLGNARKHDIALPRRAIDPCSSAATFDGWRSHVLTSRHAIARTAATVAVEPSSWLMRVGWRRGGRLLDPDHRPGPFRPSG